MKCKLWNLLTEGVASNHEIGFTEFSSARSKLMKQPNKALFEYLVQNKNDFCLLWCKCGIFCNTTHTTICLNQFQSLCKNYLFGLHLPRYCLGKTFKNLFGILKAGARIMSYFHSSFANTSLFPPCCISHSQVYIRSWSSLFEALYATFVVLTPQHSTRLVSQWFTSVENNEFLPVLWWIIPNMLRTNSVGGVLVE